MVTTFGATATPWECLEEKPLSTTIVYHGGDSLNSETGSPGEHICKPREVGIPRGNASENDREDSVSVIN